MQGYDLTVWKGRVVIVVVQRQNIQLYLLTMVLWKESVNRMYVYINARPPPAIRIFCMRDVFAFRFSSHPLNYPKGALLYSPSPAGRVVRVLVVITHVPLISKWQFNRFQDYVSTLLDTVSIQNLAFLLFKIIIQAYKENGFRF